ncbi:glycoside hydrolase family 71 protein [Amylostereum chailletii]|nr:glycoside hydrolase family 71 protein [Amylostereum chailletii]
MLMITNPLLKVPRFVVPSPSARCPESANFSLFFSFDFAHTWDAPSMVSLVAAHADSPSTFRWNGDVLVSTFNGQTNDDAFWANLKSTLSAQGITISLAPAFTSFRDPSQANTLLSTFPSIDGFTNWWSWPADNGDLLTTDTDKAYQAAIASRSGPFIMAVSPWQFKNLDSAGGNTDQDWVELSDTLWKYRWEQAINDVNADIVEIVTWNDYAESHYISAVNPNVFMADDAHAYIDGIDHTAWQIVAKYYVAWYLTGGAPAVKKDQIVYWYRLHPKDAVCTTPTKPRNSEFPADAVFGFALLTDAATVALDMGTNHFEWDAPAGVSIGQVKFSSEDGQAPRVQAVRGGSTILDGTGSTAVTQSCATYNFNPFVGVVG